jgi:hypothetical protein
MEKIQDGNKYPRPYRSYGVISIDQNGYPVLTRFYSGENQTGYTMFEWNQKNYSDSHITDESFTSAFDTPVSLANPNIVSGSEVVTSSDGLTTYVNGTDYTMDYVGGKITVLSTGSMVDATSYLIDYNYMIANTIGKIDKWSVQNINTDK